MTSDRSESRARSRSGKTSLIKAVEGIVVPITAGALRTYRAWDRRRAEAEMSIAQSVRFADGWLPGVIEEWTREAGALGWVASDGRTLNVTCDKELAALAHLQEADGWVVHLVVENAGRTARVRAGRCHRSTPTPRVEQLWTDDDRLTYEEFKAGALCRGCGRGFFGGPEWVPILHRTPEQVFAIEVEEAEFKRLHRDCHAGRWTMAGAGVTHCMRCCAPAPMSPATADRVAKVVTDVLARTAICEQELDERWRAAGRESSRSARKAVAPEISIISDAEVARLKKQANAAGFDLWSVRTPRAADDRLR